jgi:poly(A) polymerase
MRCTTIYTTATRCTTIYTTADAATHSAAADSGHAGSAVVARTLTAVPAEDSSALSVAQRRAVASLLQVAPVVDDLAARFTAAGHEFSLVGGSVRDALLGRLQQDLDFATDARPDQILALVRPVADAVWETGIAYGTVGARRGAYLL